jgi:hypothetical protein
MAEAYSIVYAPEAVEDIRGLHAFDRKAIFDVIEHALVHAADA